MKGTKLLALVVLVALIATVTSCGPTPEPETIVQEVTRVIEKEVAGETVIETVVVEKEVEIVVTPTPLPPVEEKTLTIAQLWTATTFEPHCGYQEIQKKRVDGQIIETLAGFDTEMNVVPLLATSWELIDDTTWQFKLREGVKFHNGEEFDAEAVKFSVDRIIDPECQGGYLAYINKLVGAEVVDKYTVNLITDGPFPTLVQGVSASLQIVPPKYLDEVGDEYFGQHPIGTGPFKFVEWRPREYIVMEANPDYWGGRPKLDKVVWKLIPDEVTRVSALKAGEVDAIFPLTADSATEIEASGLTVYRIPPPFGYTGDFNEKLWDSNPLGDVRVRQAMNYAVDKQAIIDEIFLGYAKPLGCVVPTPSFGRNPNLEDYPYDPDKATELLAEAGWMPGADGVLVNAAGQRFEITWDARTGYYQPDIATAVVEFLRKVGMDVEINVIEEGRFGSLRREEKLNAIYGAAWGNVGDASQALIWYTKASTLGVYHFDPRLDELILGSLSIIDPETRKEMLYEAQEIMCNEAKALFLFGLEQLWGLNPKVENYDMSPLGFLDLRNTDIK